MEARSCDALTSRLPFRTRQIDALEPTSMIRRDYILRLVAEMAQILMRAVSLKHRQEYEQALREVQEALRKVGENDADVGPAQTVEGWIALCRKHEFAASGLLVPVADLLREQGEI